MSPVATMPSTSTLPENQSFQACIDMLNKCRQICEECFLVCIHEPDASARMNSIKEIVDCSEFCSTTARYASRRSKHIREMFSLCAHICDSCAKECDNFTDNHFKLCSDTCRQCAEECRKLVDL